MIKLFHSYQYIKNTNSIKFNYKTKTLENEQGEFLLGLIGIPDIPDTNLTIEKLLVSKRLSKRSYYKNHTHYNLKIYVNINKNNIKPYLEYSSEYNKHILYNLLRKNYIQYSLNDSIFDSICVKENQNNISSKLLNLNLDQNIKIGKCSINLFNNSYTISNNQSKEKGKNIRFNGGVIISDNTNKNREKLLNMDCLDIKGTSKILVVLRNNVELELWKNSLNKKKVKFNYITSKNTSLNLNNTNTDKIYIILKDELFITDNLINLNVFTSVILLGFDSLDYFKSHKGSLWVINNDSSINNIIKLVSLHNSIDTNIFYNIDNLYQLSKLITLINNQSKKKKKNIVTSLSDNFKNVMILTKNCEAKINDSCLECVICLQKNKNIIKTECSHNYCFDCFNDTINQVKHESLCKLATPINHCPIINNYQFINNMRCGVCREPLKNQKLTILFDKMKSTPFIKTFSKIINSNTDFIILSNNVRFLNFFTTIIRMLLKNNASISCVSDNNFILKENSLIIVDYIFNKKMEELIYHYSDINNCIIIK